jgi:hypothetical protein
MDRAEAEAIYDAGRERCVEVMLELAGAVRRLGDQCERLEARIRRLEEQAGRDSRTSSAPPSQDPPKTRQQRRAEARAKAKELLRRAGERRKSGGQPGHPGAGRELAPEDQVDEIVEHFPDACRGCGHEFSEQERRPGGRFGRRQIAELPPISVTLVEHRTRRLRCPACGARTTGELPAGIGGCAFGPRLRAAVVTLTARDRVSRRGASELAGELFGAHLCTGTVDAICRHASDALARPYDQLRGWVLGQDALHVDETGWRTAGDSRALWTATSAQGSFFEIAERCNREQFDRLIGPLSGILVSDRWNGYEHLDPARRQVCWSHIQRDLRRHSEGLAEQKTFGEQGLQLTARVFKAWRAYQHQHHNLAHLKTELEPVQHELRVLLQAASRRADAPAITAASPTTCSRAGPRSGPSPPTPASRRPTTPPNARSADRSSTESARTAPAQTTANDSPNARSRSPSPAANGDTRCSSSSPNC